MLKREKEIAGQIFYIASDDRARVLMDDHIEWLEEKLAEIKRLSGLLPRIECNKESKHH